MLMEFKLGVSNQECLTCAWHLCVGSISALLVMAAIMSLVLLAVGLAFPQTDLATGFQSKLLLRLRTTLAGS